MNQTYEQKYSLQEVLFSENMSRLDFARINYHAVFNSEIKVNVWRNHSFESLLPYLNHFFAFVIFSIISFLTFIKSNQIILCLYLIFLSITLEILHYFIPERSFEFSDLFGNFFGVILIIILFYIFRKK